MRGKSISPWRRTPGKTGGESGSSSIAISRKPNECNGFAIISCNRSDLASSNGCRRLRPFAGVCRFFYFNDTRNGTRRDALREFLPRDSCPGPTNALGNHPERFGQWGAQRQDSPRAGVHSRTPTTSGSRDATRKQRPLLLEDQLSELGKVPAPQRPHVALVRELHVSVFHAPRIQEVPELTIHAKQSVACADAEP